MVGPIFNYLTPFKWQKWNLVRFQTPADDNCLFHAICNSFFEPYKTGIFKSKKISQYDLVMSLRRDIANKLEAINPETGYTYYHSINNGNTSAFSGDVPEFSLSTMKTMLTSRTPIGYGYMEHIGNCLNKDIYIIDGNKMDIYVTDELPLTITGQRKSIILYYTSGHYELVGIDQHLLCPTNPFQTHFDPQHPLIQELYSRVQTILNNAETLGS